MPTNSAILIINQDVSVVALRSIVEEFSLHHLLVVSTHQLYPSEFAALANLTPTVDMMTFADLLSDREMAACDETARQVLASELETNGRRHYSRAFMASSRRIKNEKVLAKVRDRLPDARLFHQDGLGIDGSVWQSARSMAIAPPSGPVKSHTLFQRLRRATGGEIYLVSQESTGKLALFFGSIRRIVLANKIHVQRIAWPLDWELTPPAVNAAAIFCTLRTRGIRKLPLVYTTIHQYSLGMSKLAEALGGQLHIIADGHHPSNYPASYIEMFGSGNFVASNPLSAGWLLAHGRQVLPGHWFQADPEFRQCTSLDKVRLVMLALNHAGDWSALIERSDTDRLVLAFIELARGRPELEFVIRTHPTMSTPDHEGENALLRITALLADARLPNLSLSSLSLEEDLQRGDLYLSEYSQVLIDAWARGKLGAAVNLTRRRSFMTDYEALGFLAANSYKGLETLMENALHNLPVFRRRHDQAVECFNATSSHWRNTAKIKMSAPSSPEDL